MHVLRPDPRVLLATALTIVVLAFMALTLPTRLSGLDLQLGSGSASGSFPDVPTATHPTNAVAGTGKRSIFTDPLASPLETLERPVATHPAQ
jgi:hypothetical protein